MSNETQVTRTPEQEQRIARASAKLKAAELRLQACQNDQRAEGYNRQAMHPAYDGQSEICCGKADNEVAYGNKLRAQADLIEAEAGC